MKNIILYTLLVSIFTRIGKIYFGDITYIINLLPILGILGLKILFYKSRIFILNKVDFMVFLFFLFILIDLFISSLRGSFNAQLLVVLYIVIPVLIYPLIRITRYSLESFSQHILIFSIFYSLYVIIEFVLYVNMPELKGIVSMYLQSIGSINIYPPNVHYPFIGYANKPWGPMFDTSATGVLLVVLFSFLYDSKNFVNKKILKITLIIMLTAIFLSGSKSAYLMILIYIFLRTTVFSNKKLSYGKILFISILFSFGIVVLILFINFFFTKELLDWYIYAMIIEPINNIFLGLYQNGIYSLLGSGQDNGYYKTFGLSEIDLFNAIFRYGLISMSIFMSLLGYLIIKSKYRYPQFSMLFLMSFVSMVHYQVILKYPASMILFTAIAVFKNETSQKRGNINK